MKITNLIIFLCLGVSSSLSSVNVKLANDDESRKKIAAEILDNLIKENYDQITEEFSIALKRTLTVEQISSAWSDFIEIYGTFSEKISTEASKPQGYDLIKIRCKFENDNGTIEVYFNENDKVVGLFLKP